jgi:glycosyltransferase involved in cell wall biosynthesis
MQPGDGRATARAQEPSQSAQREPLRVLWLIDSLAESGVDSLVLPFARATERDELALMLCSLEPMAGHPWEKRLADAGVVVVSVGARGPRDLAAFRRLGRLLREKRIQLVHAHGSWAVLWGVPACRRAKVPIIATLHHGPTSAHGFHRDSLREWLMMEMLRWRKAVTIAVSESVRKAFLQKYSLPAHRIQSVYSGVKTVTFERRNRERAIELRSRFALPQNAPVLITAAPLRPTAGIDVLFRALQALLKSAPDTRLIVVGDGPMREQWTRLAQHLGLEKAVHWAGERDDLPALLAGADVLVLPSREDSFPIVLLEGMATELPVVATQVGSIPEIVSSPEVGVLVPPRDPGALSREILRLIDDPARRQSLGVAARRRVAEGFPAQRWLNGMKAIYREALGELPRPLKIAVVEFAGGGEPIHYAFQLCRAMAKERADVTLLTGVNYELAAAEHPFRLEKIFRSQGPPFGPNGGTKKGLAPFRTALRRVGDWLRLLKHLGAERYDVIQFGDLRSGPDLFFLQLVRRRARVLAAVCHDVRRFAAEKKPALLGRAYRLFDRVFVHYEANRGRFTAAFPSSADRVQVIAQGNQELFREIRAPLVTANRLRTQLGFLPGEEVILYFGDLADSRGIDLLVEAFAWVVLRHTRSRLVLAGPRREGFSIEQHLGLARGLASGERTRFVEGYVEPGTVAAWMELAAVVVFPGRDTPQSDTLQIARTLGVPIVSSANGTPAELLEGGVTGLRLTQDYPEVLADAIASVLDDPEMGRRLADAARSSAEQQRWNAIAREILNTYKQDFVRRAG